MELGTGEAKDSAPICPQCSGKMIKKSTLDYMQQEAEKQERIEGAKRKLMQMKADLGSMSGDEFRKKYGAPQKVWAETQFELYLARQGMTMEEYKENGRKLVERRKRRLQAARNQKKR